MEGWRTHSVKERTVTFAVFQGKVKEDRKGYGWKDVLVSEVTRRSEKEGSLRPWGKIPSRSTEKIPGHIPPSIARVSIIHPSGSSSAQRMTFRT